jgi:hypothetical protein
MSLVVKTNDDGTFTVKCGETEVVLGHPKPDAKKAEPASDEVAASSGGGSTPAGQTPQPLRLPVDRPFIPRVRLLTDPTLDEDWFGDRPFVIEWHDPAQFRAELKKRLLGTSPITVEIPRGRELAVEDLLGTSDALLGNHSLSVLLAPKKL